MQLLQRGRVAKWTKERLDTLSTIELRQLLANAERLQETDVAALCSELLGGTCIIGAAPGGGTRIEVSVPR